MKKIIATLALALCFAVPSRAQLPIQSLGFGFNIIAQNFTPNTTAGTATQFLIGLPSTSGSFSIQFVGRTSATFTANVTLTSFANNYLNGFQANGGPLTCSNYPSNTLSNISQSISSVVGVTLTNWTINCPAPSSGIFSLVIFATVPQTMDIFVTVNGNATPPAALSSFSGIPVNGGSQGYGTLLVNTPNLILGLLGPSGQATPLATKVVARKTHYTGTLAQSIGVAGSQWLHTVTINTGAAATFTIFDLTPGSCTGTPSTNQVAIITMTAAMAPVTLTYDAALTVGPGICVQASATGADITITSD